MFCRNLIVVFKPVKNNFVLLSEANHQLLRLSVSINLFCFFVFLVGLSQVLKLIKKELIVKCCRTMETIACIWNVIETFAITWPGHRMADKVFATRKLVLMH